MTTLMCWCGVDSRGPTSLYIATDSRFSWPNQMHWDAGRKIGLAAGQPAMLALAGDVTLSQSVILGLDQASLSDAVIAARLENATAGYPCSGLDGSAVVFARRDGMGMESSFRVTSHIYRQGAWVCTEHLIPTDESGVVCAYGTGGAFAKAAVDTWKANDVSGRTSRSAFSGFCDALRQGRDPQTGGAPQLAGLYRSGPAREFGIVWNGQLVLAGTELVVGAELECIEWRNDLLERCDPSTKQRMSGAQRHARPYSLRSSAR